MSRNKEAPKSREEIVQGQSEAPLLMTLSIDRSTGRFIFVHNCSPNEGDLRMLHEAVQTLAQQLMNDRILLASSHNGHLAETEQSATVKE